MNKDNIIEELRGFLVSILSMDQEKQEIAVNELYDEACLLQSPYMVLSGRAEILRSYKSLSTNNMELTVKIQSITFDPVQQTCLADIKQLIRPKALGGVMSINMHFILKAQLEKSDDGLYRIVDHQEIHVAQDLISQMPILGGWYDGTIRNAVGQISLAGTSLLDYSGFLDFAPRAVDATKSTASSIKNKVTGLASSTLRLGGSALNATGVPSLIGNIAGLVKWGAASLSEQGKEKIDCYSPTCTPGTICYSPSCPRGKSFSFLSTEAVQDIIKGAYTVGTSKIGFLHHTQEVENSDSTQKDQAK